jgi:hypothetical protein
MLHRRRRRCRCRGRPLVYILSRPHRNESRDGVCSCNPSVNLHIVQVQYCITPPRPPPPHYPRSTTYQYPRSTPAANSRQIHLPHGSSKELQSHNATSGLASPLLQLPIPLHRPAFCGGQQRTRIPGKPVNCAYRARSRDRPSGEEVNAVQRNKQQQPLRSLETPPSSLPSPSSPHLTGTYGVIEGMDATSALLLGQTIPTFTIHPSTPQQA